MQAFLTSRGGANLHSHSFSMPSFALGSLPSLPAGGLNALFTAWLGWEKKPTSMILCSPPQPTVQPPHISHTASTHPTGSDGCGDRGQSPRSGDRTLRGHPCPKAAGSSHAPLTTGDKFLQPLGERAVFTTVFTTSRTTRVAVLVSQNRLPLKCQHGRSHWLSIFLLYCIRDTQ